MRIVSTVVSRPLDACWRVFVDPEAMLSWVPGLREAQIVRARADGLAEEIRFEYAADLTYSLAYTYDLASHVVRWEPVSNELKRGSVRGFARFTTTEGGTELTYAIEHEGGRKAAERALDDPEFLVESFRQWMLEHRD